MEKSNKTRISGENVYIKKGRKYEPIGMCMPYDWFGEGIWILKKKPNCKSYKSGEYLYNMFKICDNVDQPTIQQISSLDDYCTYAMEGQTWKKLTEDGFSLTEFTHYLVGKIFEYNQKLEEERKKEK